MNILYVLPTVTHPSMRGELRHYHFLKALAARHAVTLLSIAKADLSAIAEQELRACTERLIVINASATAGMPPSNVFGRGARRLAKHRRFQHAYAELRETLHREVRARHYDLALCYGIDLYPVFAGFREVPLIFDLCDATSQRLKHRLRFTNVVELPWRIYRYFQVRRWERRVAALTPDVVFISRRDRDSAAGRPLSPWVIPNGVDTAYWSAPARRTPGKSIVFTGVMDYPPNVDAACYLIRELAPRLRKQIPDCEIVIAGRNPAESVLRAARTTPQVVITGGVDDLRPYLNRAAVCVAPLRYASGTQNKILEAMSMSVPVVTTPVAADGLRLSDDDEPPLRVATEAGDLVNAVVSLMRDPHAQQDLGVRGRRFVERHFNWEASADLLDRVCLRAAARGLADSTGRAAGARARRTAPATKEKLGAVDTLA